MAELRMSQEELDKICETARQEGKKEVTTFVDYNLIPMPIIQYELWQEQKKEWGIK